MPGTLSSQAFPPRVFKVAPDGGTVIVTGDKMEAQRGTSQPASCISGHGSCTSLYAAFLAHCYFFSCVHLDTSGLEKKSRNHFHFIFILCNRNPDVSNGSLGDMLYSSLNSE